MSPLLHLPALQRLEGARSVLLAGAGGGFDFLAGLPLFFALRDRGVAVHLANLSFSHLHAARWPHPDVARVDRRTPADDYFPEQALAEWFARRGEDVPIYALRNEGVEPTRRAYEWLARELDLDALVLVDGGSDALLRGDEAGLGTPNEDYTSIAAASRVRVATRMLVSLGFGVDAYHGVCHAHVLRAVAELTRAGGYLGALSLVPDMPAVRAYEEAASFVQARTDARPSIVTASIRDAIAGHFGDHHSTPRTAGSQLFINPLMALYWFFELDAVASRNLAVPRLEGTRSWRDVDRAIAEIRAGLRERVKWEDIPL
jgi:hypothetical protein